MQQTNEESEVKAGWEYTRLWMGLYDYEDGANSYFNRATHDIDNIMKRLHLRWPDRQVPPKEWFEGVIYDNALWEKLDKENDEYMKRSE